MTDHELNKRLTALEVSVRRILRILDAEGMLEEEKAACEPVADVEMKRLGESLLGAVDRIAKATLR